MLCTHKTASSASLVLEICHQFTNSFLHQFSSIFGRNCITQPCDILEFPSETRVTCLRTTDQLLPALPFPTPPSPKDIIWHPIIESGKQLQLNTSHSIGKMAKATLLTSSANIGSLQLCGPCSSLSCSGGARLPPN